MNEFEIKLKLLIDILLKKNIYLNNLYNITENQNDLIKTEKLTKDIKDIFLNMNKEKDKYIKEVIKNNNTFEKIFFEIKDVFEENAVYYKKYIEKLQELIKISSELDIKIRVYEDKNKKILEQKNKYKQETISSKNTKKYYKNYIIEKYKKNCKVK